MATTATKVALPYTGDPAADQLLAEDPLALVIGLALDQQVPVQKAFRGPYDLRQRLGHLDAGRIARMDAGKLETVFQQRPAIHRFPAAMARRVQELCAVIVREYQGDARRIWEGAPDAATVAKRLAALPGFGEMKVRTMMAILPKRLGVKPRGWETLVPRHPTLGDVDTPAALADYQMKKRLHKAAVRAAEAKPRSKEAR
jgi:uncharacterized HhH-GPD family protein